MFVSAVIPLGLNGEKVMIFLNVRLPSHTMSYVRIKTITKFNGVSNYHQSIPKIKFLHTRPQMQASDVENNVIHSLSLSFPSPVSSYRWKCL
jgi:hypothetical protein